MRTIVNEKPNLLTPQLFKCFLKPRMKQYTKFLHFAWSKSKLHMQNNKFDILHRLGKVVMIRSILGLIAVLRS